MGWGKGGGAERLYAKLVARVYQEGDCRLSALWIVGKASHAGGAPMICFLSWDAFLTISIPPVN